MKKNAKKQILLGLVFIGLSIFFFSLSNTQEVDLDISKTKELSPAEQAIIYKALVKALKADDTVILEAILRAYPNYNIDFIPNGKTTILLKAIDYENSDAVDAILEYKPSLFVRKAYDRVEDDYDDDDCGRAFFFFLDDSSCDVLDDISFSLERYMKEKSVNQKRTDSSSKINQ